MPSSKQHFLALEWLRFGLGTYIVLFHTFHFDGMSEWMVKFTQLGFFSTSTFFVLSGFLLSHVYLTRNADHSVVMRESAKSFLIKRFANLYPIHIFSLLATLVIVSALPFFMVTPDDAGSSIRFILYDRNDYADALSLRHYMTNAELVLAFIMNFTLLQSLNPYYLTFNAPAWTVSTLFCLYLLFPFLAVRLSRIDNPLKAMIGMNVLYLLPVIAVIAFTGFSAPETGILHRNPLVRLPEFAAGILLCSLYHRQRAVGYKLTTKVVSLLLVLIGLSLFGASRFLEMAHAISKTGNVPYYLLHDGLLLPAQVALVYLCLHVKLPNSNSFIKWSQRFGGASLPMFAFHVPIFAVYSRIQRVLTGEPSLCTTSFKACMTHSGNLEMIYYPIYLIILFSFCFIFQERVVVVSRRAIIAIFEQKKTHVMVTTH